MDKRDISLNSVRKKLTAGQEGLQAQRVKLANDLAETIAKSRKNTTDLAGFVFAMHGIDVGNSPLTWVEREAQDSLMATYMSLRRLSGRLGAPVAAMRPSYGWQEEARGYDEARWVGRIAGDPEFSIEKVPHRGMPDNYSFVGRVVLPLSDVHVSARTDDLNHTDANFNDPEGQQILPQASSELIVVAHDVGEVAGAVNAAEVQHHAVGWNEILAKRKILVADEAALRFMGRITQVMAEFNS